MGFCSRSRLTFGQLMAFLDLDSEDEEESVSIQNRRQILVPDSPTELTETNADGADEGSLVTVVPESPLPSPEGPESQNSPAQEQSEEAGQLRCSTRPSTRPSRFLVSKIISI